MRFIEMQEAYFHLRGELGLGTNLGVISGTTNAKEEAKRQINAVIQELEATNDFPWSRTEATLDFDPTYTTGTISGTKDEAILTGVGTAWFKELEGAFIQVDGTGDSGDRHRIVSVNTALEMTLESPLLEDLPALSTYSIYRDVYSFPYDFSKLYSAYQLTDQREIHALNHKSTRTINRLLYSFDGTVTDIDIDFKATDRDYYKTGTVDIITNGATTVTFVGTDFDATNVPPFTLRVGDYLRLDRDLDRVYKIRSVTSDTVLELDEPYQGESALTGAALGYAINPAGRRRFRLLRYPDGEGQLIIEYKKKPLYLVGDNERPHPIPEAYHYSVLVYGAVLRDAVLRGLEVGSMAQQWQNSVNAIINGNSADGMRHGRIIRKWSRRQPRRAFLGREADTAFKDML